jgi:hypothetical protein
MMKGRKEGISRPTCGSRSHYNVHWRKAAWYALATLPVQAEITFKINILSRFIFS